MLLQKNTLELGGRAIVFANDFGKYSAFYVR